MPVCVARRTRGGAGGAREDGGGFGGRAEGPPARPRPSSDNSTASLPMSASGARTGQSEPGRVLFQNLWSECPQPIPGIVDSD